MDKNAIVVHITKPFFYVGTEGMKRVKNLLSRTRYAVASVASETSCQLDSRLIEFIDRHGEAIAVAIFMLVYFLD